MRVNIYIRKNNEELWDSIKDKSGFVNGLLVKEKLGDKVGHETIGKAQDEVKAKMQSGAINTLDDVRQAVAKIVSTSAKLCKIHGTPLDSRGKCLQKGCKYS